MVNKPEISAAFTSTTKCKRNDRGSFTLSATINFDFDHTILKMQSRPAPLFSLHSSTHSRIISRTGKWDFVGRSTKSKWTFSLLSFGSVFIFIFFTFHLSVAFQRLHFGWGRHSSSFSLFVTLNSCCVLNRDNKTVCLTFNFKSY